MGMRASSAPKLLLALVGALPFFWLSGRVVEALPSSWALFEQSSTQTNEIAVMVALFWCGTLLTALAVGMVLALVARAVGHATIRAVLSPSQAQRFGLLATALVWLAITGYAWSDFSGKSDVEMMAWQLALGVFFNVFNVVWLLLGIRAAASARQLRTAGVFFGASFGTFVGVLGVFLLLALLFNGIDIQPTLPLFGLAYLLVIGIWIVTPALAVVGGAALCAGLLAARGSSGGSSAARDA
jgi:hypothetical protein